MKYRIKIITYKNGRQTFHPALITNLKTKPL